MRLSNRLRTIAFAGSLAAVALPTGAAAYPGDLDPSFGEFGKVTHGARTAKDLSVESGGRIVVAASGPLLGYSSSGVLDSSFGLRGSTSVPGSTSLTAVATQTDGKLLVAGTRFPYNHPTIVLARLSADGALDPSFGTDGVLTVDLGVNGIDDADLAIGANGEIVIAASSPSGFLVARRLADGSPDPSFAGGGAALVGVGDPAGVAVEALGDGSVLVAGTVASGGATQGRVAKLSPAGALDPGFSGDGVADPGLGSPGVANGIAVDAQGRVVVAGQDAGLNSAASRLTANGEPDPSFNAAAGPPGAFHAVAIQPDGAIVLAASDFSITRLTGDGAPDLGFGRDGRARVSVTLSDFTDVYALALQPDGRILAAGDAGSNSFRGPSASLALMRFLVGGDVRDADADGVPDKRDRCRYDPAIKHRGCPFIGRHLTFRRKAFGFDGVMSVSGPFRCARGSKVTLFSARPGRDRAIARAQITRGSGRYRFRVAHPVGDYYARAKGRVLLGVGLCGAVRSRRLGPG